MGEVVIMSEQLQPPPGSHQAPYWQYFGSGITVQGWGFRHNGGTHLSFTLLLDTTYGSGLTVTLGWSAESATSGAVRWGAEVSSETQNVSTTNLRGNTHDSSTFVNASHPGTTAGRLIETDIDMSSANESAAAGDLLHVNVSRIGGNAADTMSGNALLHYVKVSWTDA